MSNAPEQPQSMQVLPQLTSLNRVVLDLVDLYQPAFTRKRLGSGLDLDPSLPLTWIDAPQLERGLADLLRNAVKHTRDGDLIFCQTAQDGDWIQLTIGDNGPSLSSDEVEATADSGQETTERRNELVLDSLQAIVAAHGGEITLDTSHGSGAWFIVRLPAIALENARLTQELEHGTRLTYDMMATLSYELRTPLNVIMGYNDLLLDGAFGPLAPAQVDTLRRVDLSLRELLNLVNATLDLSRHRNDRPRRERDRSRQKKRKLASLARENARLVEQLEEAKRLKAEFVSTTSHQLRIPLNVIAGYNDLMIDGEFGPLTGEQRTVLERVRKSALELLEAINSNLVLSRLDEDADGGQ